MRKTKIICTLGPSTDKEGVLRDLIANGMNVARFNFSHGSHEEHLGRLEKLKALREELGKPVAALLDTKGPEIRLKDFKNGVENLVAGQTFTLTTRDVEGTNEICSITYKDLPMDVEPNGTIMLDDGLIKLQIQTVNDTDIVCTVLNNGKIKNKKGVNVPGVHLSMPYMSQRDKDDIIFGIQQGYDFIAASFVRTAQDVYDIRNLLNQYDSNIRIIAKIENREGVNNIDSILAAADAVMVARGDLGVEIDFTELPGIQKTIIDRSFSFGKPIVTATQMLDSMMVNPRPTRAEISDVANAIYDGTGAVMLSGETAAGKYPVEALKAMATIAEATETTAGLMPPASMKKLNGIDEGANKYTHPSHTSRASGLYKITVDSLGHVTAVSAVQKSDITGLGIPGSDTTYSLASAYNNGLMSSDQYSKLSGIESGANKTTVDAALSGSSANPVQNKILYVALPWEYYATFYVDSWTTASTDEQAQGFAYKQTVYPSKKISVAPNLTANSMFLSLGSTNKTNVFATDVILADSMDKINGGLVYTGAGTITALVEEKPSSDVVMNWWLRT